MAYEERVKIIQSIKGVARVISQDTLSYKKNLEELKPDYLVHGDNWKEGFQRAIREEAIEVLASYGGILKEFAYSSDAQYQRLEDASRDRLSIPDVRRSRLKKLLGMKTTVNAIEAHNGLTGILAEKTQVLEEGKAYQFDAMWVSSLCDSTSRGKPDIELHIAHIYSLYHLFHFCTNLVLRNFFCTIICQNFSFLIYIIKSYIHTN